MTTPSVDYPAMGALLAADGLKACFRELAREEAGALVEVVVQLDVHGAVTDLAVSPSQWSGSRLEACVRDTLSAARGPGGEAVSVTLAFRSGPPNP